MRRPEDELAALEAAHLRRQIPTAGKTPALDFSSNDYLGLADHPRLREALAVAAHAHPAGAAASRLVSGTQPVHFEAEATLAQLKHAPAALLFSSGYAAALGTIQALAQRGDLVLLDRLCHASLIDGTRLSGASLRPFRHNDANHLEAELQRARARLPATARLLVLAESVYSMDGDCAPVADFAALCARFGAVLVLDEAHALGVLGPQGRGLAAAAQITDFPDLIQVGTLSKAAGLQGGFVAAAEAWIALILNRARSFIYTTGVLPALAGAVPAALELLTGPEGDARRDHLTRLRHQLGHALHGQLAPSAILPVPVASEAAALHLAEQLRSRGLRVPAIRFPTVSRGQARLRISLSANHQAAALDTLLHALKELGILANS